MSDGIMIDQVDQDAVGTTINSPETVGTFKLQGDKNENLRIIGILSRAILTGGVTSAEAQLGKFIYSSSAADLNNFRVPSGMCYGGAPATNIAPAEVREVFTAIMKNDLGSGDEILVEFDSVQPEPTSEICAESFLVYDNGSTPQEIVDKWLDFGVRGVLPTHQDMKVGDDDEIGDAASEPLDNNATIDAKYSAIVGAITEAAPDSLATDEEHFGGYLDMDSNLTYKGPLKIPIPAMHPELGASVGAPIVLRSLNIPLWINKVGQKAEFTATAEILQATTGAFAVQYGMAARN